MQTPEQQQTNRQENDPDWEEDKPARGDQKRSSNRRGQLMWIVDPALTQSMAHLAYAEESTQDSHQRAAGEQRAEENADPKENPGGLHGREQPSASHLARVGAPITTVPCWEIAAATVPAGSVPPAARSNAAPRCTPDWCGARTSPAGPTPCAGATSGRN